MKVSYPEVKANFIVDSEGNKKQVVLEIEQFNELLETLQDYYDIASSVLSEKNLDEALDLEDVKKQVLKK